jgi:hypothetical protein
MTPLAARILGVVPLALKRITSMKKARKGGLPSFESVDALMADLHADD